MLPFAARLCSYSSAQLCLYAAHLCAAPEMQVTNTWTDRFTATDWWRLSPPLRTRRPARAVGDPQRRGAITACTPIRRWASGSTSVAAPSANRIVEYAMAQRRHSIGASLCTGISLRLCCDACAFAARLCSYAGTQLCLYATAHLCAYVRPRNVERVDGGGCRRPCGRGGGRKRFGPRPSRGQRATNVRRISAAVRLRRDRPAPRRRAPCA
jgi:hypothetical protein